MLEKSNFYPRMRYAPSPTGKLHIGGARTALFNFLLAKRKNGKFIVRFENTDVQRNVDQSINGHLQLLRWLGIIDDESIQSEGIVGPYLQTRRLPIYKAYINILLNRGLAFYCYCDWFRKTTYRDDNIPNYDDKKYACNCSSIGKKKRRGSSVIKIKTILGVKKKYSFTDLVRGRIDFDPKQVGEFIIMRSNGLPTYNFAVVVDDHLMDISHVFRGDEHITNTARQIFLYHVFGWTTPSFGHLSLVVGKDGKKISKRDQHDKNLLLFIDQYQKLGYFSEALINYFVSLGWRSPTTNEFFNIFTLKKIFNEKQFGSSPAMFDMEKLRWFNQHYIMKTDVEEYFKRFKNWAKKYCLSSQCRLLLRREWWERKTKKILLLLKKEIKCFSDVIDMVDYFIYLPKMSLKTEKYLEKWKKKGVNLANDLQLFLTRIEEWDKFNISKSVSGVGKKWLVSQRDMMLFLRANITGNLIGPSILEIMEIIGKQESIKRISFFSSKKRNLD